MCRTTTNLVKSNDAHLLRLTVLTSKRFVRIPRLGEGLSLLPSTLASVAGDVAYLIGNH